MHADSHNILLIAIASSSFAALIFLLFYILYVEADESSRRKVVGVGGTDEKSEYVTEAGRRPQFLSRAIGGSNQQNLESLRSFRAANMLLVTLPIALRLYRERMAEEHASATAMK